MYSSTYYAYNDTAFAHARSLGFIIDERATRGRIPRAGVDIGLHAIAHGASGNWSPAVDRLCA